jgi:hypothetical protein
MRAGAFVSAIGHVGAIVMTMLAWEARPTEMASVGAVVPVEIVALGPESNVRALAQPVPEEDLAPEEQTETREAAPVSTAAPDPRPRPPQPRQDEELDLDALARLFNADLTRQHIQRCWRMPVDLPNPDRLVITVQFELDRNGRLRGQPRVTNPPNYRMNPAMGAAGEAALRAVRMCDPYPFPNDPAVGQHYEAWDQLEYTFRPRL